MELFHFIYVKVYICPILSFDFRSSFPDLQTCYLHSHYAIEGAVSEKYADQGACGSCWAYGAVGALEGALAIKTGEFKDISQQYLMDCTWRYGNNACEGGLDFMGYSWVLEQNGGKIPGYADYGMPGVGGYLNVNGFCHYYSETTKNPWTEKEIPSVGVMDACYHVNDQWNSTTPVMSDEALVDTLLDALANVGPVSISIAVTPELYYYSGGIFDQSECESDIESLDHSVLATGYETLDDGRIVVYMRNSWPRLYHLHAGRYLSQYQS
jgi:hypothetical protein